MNLGQLLKLVRAEFLVDAVGYNRVRGVPFRSGELAEAIESMLPGGGVAPGGGGGGGARPGWGGAARPGGR